MRIAIQLTPLFVLTLIISLLHGNAEASDQKPWTWFTDFRDAPASPVTDDDVLTWVSQAASGNMRIKRQFAYAYFGCGGWTNKERCTAMRSRSDLGEYFLKEIIDSPAVANDPHDQHDIGRFQALYAKKMYKSAAPSFDEYSSNCQQFVKYSLLAMDNDAPCIANAFRVASRQGRCMKKDDMRYQKYYAISDRCPLD